MKRKDLILIFVAIILAMGAAFTTGTRSVVFFMIALVPIFLFMLMARGLISIISLIRILTAGLFLGAVVAYFFSDAISALIFRAQNSDSNIGRVLIFFTEPVDAFFAVPFFGTGLGTNSNASISIMGGALPYWLNGFQFEGESARIIQEIGVPGFMLYFTLRISIAYLAFHYMRMHRDRVYIAFCMAAFVFFVLHMFVPLVNNPTAGVYYWAMAGMVLATGRIARKDFAAANGLDEAMQPRLYPDQRFRTPATA